MNNIGGADRIPPFNLEAERAVLGAALIERDALITLVEGLCADDFYDPRHRSAFEVMSAMYTKELAVDALTFKDELVKQGLEERIGGLPFIGALLDAVTNTANIEHHVGIVRDKSIHRSLITVGSEISRLGFSEDMEVDEALDTAEQRVFDIVKSGGKTTNIRASKDVVKSALAEIEKRLAAGVSMTGVPTGFKVFDKISGGLQSGGLYILAARPGMGKTSWAINVAQYAAMQENIPVLVFSLEMSAEQIAQRMLAAEAEVNLNQICASRNIQSDQWNLLSKAAGRISVCPLYIDDSSNLSTLDMRGRCRRFFAKHKSEKGLVVLDYLQLMSIPRKIENRQQEVSEISRALKGIAREFKVPVLALSQLSREVEKRKESKVPLLSDLRDSGAIEQDADMVLFLYRDSYYNKESEDASACLSVAKNRNGPTQDITLIFFNEYAKFKNALGNM